MKKKSFIQLYRGIFVLAISAIAFTSCKKIVDGGGGTSGGTTSDPDYLKKLLAYKKSKHPMMVGYFNQAEMVGTAGYEHASLRNVPDSVDIVDIFATVDDTNKDMLAKKEVIQKDIKILQQKGTKVVVNVWLTRCFTNFKNGTVAYQHNATDYAKWAKQVYDYYQDWGFDGIDVDMEPGIVYNNTQNKGLLDALAKYYGPKSPEGKLFIFDTDGALGIDIFNNTYTNYNQIYFQAYNRSGDRWWGKPADLTKEMNTYGSKIGNDNFFAIVNGEGDSAGWKVNSYFGGTRVQIVEYAQWAIDNKAGGAGAYGLNYDYKNSNYVNVKAAITLMNPPKP
ncbi:hypothetical protein TH53_02135 [Pedobacter lusitanus]|uniref:mannosyl-glycoprotein endo-beta-N-acetylglucosaminidase n=1 Tax=Pedobacter lusitanus TaxID=1503925 RepID=A0A0D0G1N6_9SPHI|nr:glycoside hydrolase family 18 [Pedobacter lusitanus]KIO78704.1 hypothetical protein TH53_02135 [Pedobacter lusitanus]